MFADADADVHGYCNSYRYSERHTKTSPDSAASPDASTAPVVRQRELGDWVCAALVFSEAL